MFKFFVFVAEIVQTNNTLEIDLNKVGPAQFQSMPKYRLQGRSSFTKYCFAPQFYTKRFLKNI